MRFDWRQEIAHWGILGVMWLLAAVTWASAPEQIPVHWNIEGQVDRYGGKVEGLLFMPMLALAVYLLLLFLPRLDPARANYAKFAGAYAAIRLGILVVLVGVYGVIHLWIRGNRIDVGLAVSALVGAVLVLVGSLMGRLRPNWFVGIRTPWTMSSITVWEKTHRLGGWVFIAMGLAIFCFGLWRPAWALAGLFVVVIGGSLIPVVYYYLVWRNAPDKATGPGG
jgi:uncharacterized membrane protein